MADVLRVLIVDDDAVDRMAVRRALRDSGLETTVVEASDGVSAVARVLAAAGNGEGTRGELPFDCVLLDYQLPGTTGLEVLEAVRAGGSDVPVVMLTGQSDPETAVALMKAGAADFVPKSSVTPDRLARTVSGAVRVVTAERARQAAELASRQALAEAERARREAEEALARAEEANKAKSDFLAMMSHELRTPLNAIGGYVQLMQLGVPEPVGEVHQEYLDRLQRSQQHLLSLINSVLNYAKLEAGRVDFAIEAVTVAELEAAVESLVLPLVGTKELRYRWDGAEGDLAVYADPEKAVQVLLNLLANAVKFTPNGGEVGVTAVVVDADHVALRVHDTGVGIAADKLETVFDPFVQLDVGYTRMQEGTGLGLAISRDLARGMQGELTAESVAGEGSTFSFTLRRATAADSCAAHERRASQERRTGEEDRRHHDDRRHEDDGPPVPDDCEPSLHAARRG